MFSGLPVLLSDIVIGRLEMIDPGKSGYSYPCGDVEALAALLRKILGDPALLGYMKERHWTTQDLLDSWVGAIKVAKQVKRQQVRGVKRVSDLFDCQTARV
jgi:glycosyltransferase involved in cell wall biosynthesis